MTPDTREKIRAALISARDTLTAWSLRHEYVTEALALLVQEEAAPPTPDVEAGRAHDFLWAMNVAEQGFAAWKAKPHNAKWFRRIDGTPIPNDLRVNIAAAFVASLRASAPPEEGQPEGMETTAEERLSYATLVEERHKDRTDLTVVLGRFIQRLSRDIDRLLAERNAALASSKADRAALTRCLETQRKIEAENARLRRALKPFATEFTEVPEQSDDAVVQLFHTRRDLRRARAALAAEEGET